MGPQISNNTPNPTMGFEPLTTRSQVQSRNPTRHTLQWKKIFPGSKNVATNIQNEITFKCISAPLISARFSTTSHPSPRCHHGKSQQSKALHSEIRATAKMFSLQTFHTHETVGAGLPERQFHTGAISYNKNTVSWKCPCVFRLIVFYRW